MKKNVSVFSLVGANIYFSLLTKRHVLKYYECAKSIFRLTCLPSDVCLQNTFEYSFAEQIE